VVDRKKDMLLVGGENVYTTEVEAALQEHPAVRQAAVFGVPNRVMGELVGAAVTLAPGAPPPAPRELVAWCRQRLAEYKVPSVVHVVDRFPTTGSGKIMKTELRKMFAGGGGAAPAAAATSAAPKADPSAAVETVPGQASPGALPTALDPAEAAARLTRACGAGLARLPVDAALGVDVGRDVYPELTYVALVEHLVELPAKIAALVGAPGLRHLALLCLEPPRGGALAAAEAAAAAAGAALALLHLPRSAFQPGNDALIRTALAAARTTLPPIGGVLYWPAAAAPPPAAVAPAAPAPAAPAAPPKGPTAAEISATVLAAIGGVVGSEVAAHVAAGEPLMAAGVTSTLAVQLVTALEAAVGKELPGTLVFDYPSIAEMADFLAAELGGAAPSAPQAQAPRVAAAAAPAAAPPPPRAAAGGRARRAAVAAVIAQQVRELVGGEEVPQDTPLMAAGVTSTLAVQLVTALEAALGAELPGTLVFDYPSIAEMTDFVADTTAASAVVAAADGPAAAMQLAPAAPARQVCVVTGAAHAVPGGALDWRPAGGNDRVELVPLERWDAGPPPADDREERNLQFGSFLQGVALFDAAAFGVSPAEAVLMDPQQRLVMAAFSEALAGYLAFREPTREAGVFVGVSQLDYARTAYETGSALNTYYATGSHLSVASGRLSYTFGFKGPAMTVDTACSSSLVTTHLAARALGEGACRVAASVGVNLTLVHSWTRACLRAGMLAEDGRCKTLDASAGGFGAAQKRDKRRRPCCCWACQHALCPHAAAPSLCLAPDSRSACLPLCCADGYVRAEAVGALTLALVSPQEPIVTRQGQAPDGAARGAAGGAHAALVLLPGWHRIPC
jgi:acyl carrier protein